MTTVINETVQCDETGRVTEKLGERSAWFAGPKAENGEWFGQFVTMILEDHSYWRRNYFAEDGIVVDSHDRRVGEEFRDTFQDRLLELLARLKQDFPFHSPRYAAHMVSEQSLPAIAGYIAAMLYNPNNVSAEAAPVTVQLELEASQMIARMLGYDPSSWAHLTGGGTLANIEALWIARTVRYLPLVTADLRSRFGLAGEQDSKALMRQSPQAALEDFAELFESGAASTRALIQAYRASPWNVAEEGIAAVTARLASKAILLAPETQHYSIKKALDVLGLGRHSLRTVRVDSNFRMDVSDLRRCFERADRSGEHVLAVVTVAGSTEEGAIDPVEGILDLRSEREAAGLGSFWIHADAAYGGYFRTVTLPNRLGLGERTTRVKIGGKVREIALELPIGSTCDALERLGECDSISIDPHKLGFVPYPAGAVCFRSDIVKALARQDAPYLEDDAGSVQTERQANSIGLYVLEGSKPGAAAAAVWLSHKLIPLDKTGHGQLLQECIRNAAELHALLVNLPALSANTGVEAVPVCSPGSNILCFAFRPTEPAGLCEINTLNEAIYDRFSVSAQSGKRVANQPFFLSRTRLAPQQYSAETLMPFLNKLDVGKDEYLEQGVFVLRVVLMNPWYATAKLKGRFFVSELAEQLYRTASEIRAAQSDRAQLASTR